MKSATIVIRSNPNTLIPLPEEKKAFTWDLDEFDYSEDALHYIELLLMEQRAFTVETTDSYEYDCRRIDIMENMFSRI